MEKEDFILLLEKIVSLSRSEFNQYDIKTSEYEEKRRSSGEVLGFGVSIFLSSIKSFTKVKIFPFFTISEKNIFSIDVEFIVNDLTRIFSLKDFTVFRNIPFDPSCTYNWLDKHEDSLDMAMQLFKRLNEILSMKEMQKLLNSDYKIDVPINYSPYK